MLLYIHVQFAEEEFRMKTKQGHIEQCEYIDQPGISDSERAHYSTVYGINRTSILFPDFDVTQQLPQDLMHVLLEGIFPLHMEQLLDYVVQTLSVVTLADINSRLMTFPYAYFEEKPAPLNGLELEGNKSGSSFCISNWQSIHLLTINFVDYELYWFLIFLVSYS